ncbi:MAG TPA: CehA/McbA family metallohydrolase [Egibacteraceae bacterium]|nr:CehA/McbA family metallohydrolase [Egibacteraceae bacterium]
MGLNRRQFLSAGVASGALLFARPLGALANPLGSSTGSSASRVSRLFPGTLLAHADLHNHSLMSDGNGDPEQAFASMRAHGLDIAALTDHATTSKFVKPPCGDNTDCHSLLGIDEASWRRAGELADAAQDDGAFTALRGFEWSSPTLGHVNVWFSQTWVDPLHTAGASTGEGLGQWAREVPGLGGVAGPALDPVVEASPANGTTMRPFYEWLNGDPDTPAIGGGLDALAGFNHPGREPGRFGYFSYDGRLRDRLVSMEIFNRSEDYLFEGFDAGQPSPLSQCLDAGWRVGMLGVTDEHGTVWGNAPAKGRGGVWVTELTREGVREAMLARRFFATVVEGMRVDAAATGAGRRVRMGQALPGRPGRVRFEVDIDGGSDWTGRALNVQVLTSGYPLPTVTHAQDVIVPSASQPVISFTADLGDATWAVLRITDPSQPADKRAPADYASFGKAIAYTSPFFIES